MVNQLHLAFLRPPRTLSFLRRRGSTPCLSIDAGLSSRKPGPLSCPPLPRLIAIDQAACSGEWRVARFVNAESALQAVRLLSPFPPNGGPIRL